MKHASLALCALLAAVFVTGCGNNNSSTPAASSEPEKKIEVTGNDQMKFDVTSLEAKAGQKVVLTFKNVGTMPAASMGHDWTLLAMNTDAAKFVEAGMTHASSSYVDPALASKVIAHTKILGPGESDTVTFNAPTVPGTYEFICTFPGHFAAGMKGTFIVQ